MIEDLSIKYPKGSVWQVGYEDEATLKKTVESARRSGHHAVRVLAMPNRDSFKRICSLGFSFLDRSLKVSVSTESVNRNSLDQGALTTAECFTKNHRIEAIELAQRCFDGDSRFDFGSGASPELIANQFADYDEAICCLANGAVAGFALLDRISSDAVFVRLAATDQRFRLLGCSMALYEAIKRYSAEKGYSSLQGRVSTRNPNALNIYSRIGNPLKISQPLDVFVQQIMD